MEFLTFCAASFETFGCTGIFGLHQNGDLVGVVLEISIQNYGPPKSYHPPPTWSRVGLADAARPDAMPDTAGGEGHHGAAKPHGVIHRFRLVPPETLSLYSSTTGQSSFTIHLPPSQVRHKRLTEWLQTLLAVYARNDLHPPLLH